MKTGHLHGRLFLLVLSFSALHPRAGLSADLTVMQNGFILGAHLDKIQVEDLKRLADQGAQGFELPATLSTLADCERLGAFIKENHFPAGLNVAVDAERDPSATDADGLSKTPARVRRQAGIDYLKSRIDCAVAAGATIMAGPIVLPWGGFYATAGEYPTIELHEKYLRPKVEAAVESIRIVADYAKSKGVKLALEPLHRHEMHGLNTIEEADDFIRRVDRKDHFGLCMDSSHEVIDGAGPENYSKYVTALHRDGFFLYAQLSAPSRGDVEHSWIPWHEYLGLIKRVGLSSVTIEIMQAIEPFAGPNGCGIRLARLPFPDPYLIVRNAIRKTREMWARVP